MSNQQQKPKPQDQRSVVKNPNNPQHKQAQDNRSRQLKTPQKKSGK
jgi:hypothetical protein